jgi:uncharacterized membrane protein
MKINETYNKSREAKSRKELTLAVLASVGLMGIGVMQVAAANR